MQSQIPTGNTFVVHQNTLLVSTVYPARALWQLHAPLWVNDWCMSEQNTPEENSCLAEPLPV